MVVWSDYEPNLLITPKISYCLIEYEIIKFLLRISSEQRARTKIGYIQFNTIKKILYWVFKALVLLLGGTFLVCYSLLFLASEVSIFTRYGTYDYYRSF
jgi:hypothetical protein